MPATSVSVEVVAMLNDMEPEATPELGVPTTVYTLLVPTWVMVPTEPLVNAKSAAVGALFSASLKVTVKVSAALVVVAAILSVADTVGATVSNLIAVALEVLLPAASVRNSVTIKSPWLNPAVLNSYLPVSEFNVATALTPP